MTRKKPSGSPVTEGQRPTMIPSKISAAEETLKAEQPHTDSSLQSPSKRAIANRINGLKKHEKDLAFMRRYLARGVPDDWRLSLRCQSLLYCFGFHVHGPAFREEFERYWPGRFNIVGQIVRAISIRGAERYLYVRWKRTTIYYWLNITEEEAMKLMPPPNEPRFPRRDMRHVRVLRLFHLHRTKIGKPPSIRTMVEIMKANGYSASFDTIQKDYKILGLDEFRQQLKTVQREPETV